ncbi:MAG TPA: NusG domain II-containing protein [Spirochaetes bacterium]|nr:NusG domain II-containing protein [Spirochaetota bacterium]
MTFGDKLLIFFIVCLIGILFFKTYFRPAGDRIIVVSIRGKPVRVIANDEFLGKEVFTIPLERGEARIEIDGGKVRILPMPRKICPRGICSAIGWIERPGQAAICVPNRLIVEVRGEDKKKTVDSVSR